LTLGVSRASVRSHERLSARVEELSVLLEERTGRVEELSVLLGQRTARVEELSVLVSEQTGLIESLRVENLALRRQVGRDSSNSSKPPSSDGPASPPKRDRRERTGRSQGGQVGHRGSGLPPVAVPDHVVKVEPEACSGCHASLADAPASVASSVQVFDVPEIEISVTEYQMICRTCVCGHATTGKAPSFIRGGRTCYGPNVAAAATLLATADVISLERTAALLSALLGVDISTGFVSQCLVRLDDALTTAGFEEALKQELRAADVLGTDETPVRLTTKAREEPDTSNVQAFAARTMRKFTDGGSDLEWFGAAGNRRKTSIDAFGILPHFRGVLVRDDYGGYLAYDEKLAGVQQCLAHLHRYLADVHGMHSAEQAWAREVTDILKEATAAVKAARDRGAHRLHRDQIAALRARYDAAVEVGIATNASRPWHKGNHPGLVLAKRLQRKADQVWTFTTRFDVPPTNNGSEQSVRGLKVSQKIKGCWRTLATLQRHCRIRSYLTSSKNYGRRPLDAIRDALTGNPWMPPVTA